MGQTAEANAAPGAYGGRAGFRRLRWSHHGGDRRGDRRDTPRRDLRRRAWRLQLHLRSSSLDPVVARLDCSAREHASVHGRRAAPDRQRQPARRDHAGLLLRAVGQPHLRRHGSTLRDGSDSGAPVQAQGQGQGRSWRPVSTSSTRVVTAEVLSKSCSDGSWRDCATSGSSPWPN